MLDACVQALHRNHSPPTGAHVTGDARDGFALHIRPIDDTNAANGVLRGFMDVCGGKRQPLVSATVSDAAPQRPPSATPQRQPSTGAPQSSPATSGPPPLAQPPPFTAPSGRVTTAWGPPPPSREPLFHSSCKPVFFPLNRPSTMPDLWRIGSASFFSILVFRNRQRSMPAVLSSLITLIEPWL